MNRFFDPENALFSTISRLVDIVGLSLLWALLCIPVVTIGPATAALYYTVVKAFRQGSSATFRLFFRSLWINLKKGLLCTLIFIPVALLLCLLGHWYGLAASTQGTVGQLAYSYFYVLALIPVGLACWLFPLLGRFEFSVRGLFSTAFRLLIAHLPTTLLLLLITVAAAVLTLKFLLLIFLLPACWALLISYPLERAFAKHMPRDEDGGEDT